MADNHFPTPPKREERRNPCAFQSLHLNEVFARHPSLRQGVLSLLLGLHNDLSQSSHKRNRTQTCNMVRAEPRTDGAPQELTSQLRSLSLVTVRSAKSPRLTSPPPIVSMMKTSEEKPKEPGRGEGWVGQTGPGKERERQREAERIREAGRQDQELQLERKTGTDGQTDRAGQTKREGNRQTDDLLGQGGCRLETGPYLSGHRNPGLSSAAPRLCHRPQVTRVWGWRLPS